MRIKSFTALMLAILLAFGSLTSLAASTFSDVPDDHWAKDYIEEMYSIGLVTGYPDGTFGPGNAVSKWESLILASRVLGFNDQANAEYIDMAADQYMSKLASYNVNNKEELCYLLYWGVLNDSDLADYLSEDKKNSPELRYEAAILLTKVMGGEEEALNQSSVVIEYDDAADIPTAAKPYVSYITKLKVMQGTGNNKFDPLMQVSRAQMSTMMYNTMRAMNMETQTVTVQSVVASQNQITAYDASGNSQKYYAEDSTLYRAAGAPAAINDITSGSVITMKIQDGSVRMIEWDPDSTEKTASGKVVSANATGGGEIKIAVLNDDGTTTTKTFNVISTASVSLNGESIGLSQIKTTHYATVYYTGENNVYKIELENMNTTVNGTFVSYTVDPNTITIRLSDGTEQTYTMLDDVGVVRNNLDSSMYEISVGDRLMLVLEYHQVKSIEATSVDQTIEGTIKELTFGDTNYITVKLSDSSTEKIVITESTQIFIDDASSNMYALRPGAQVKVTTKSANADKIYSYAVVAPSQIVGVVTAVNSTYSIVTINNAETGTDQQVVIKSNCTFIDNSNSGINSLSKLKPGYQVLVLGTMSNGAYLVNTLIVTQ